MRDRKKKALIVILDKEDYVSIDIGLVKGSVAPPLKSRLRRIKRLL
jgi:hypothetical protein